MRWMTSWTVLLVACGDGESDSSGDGGAGGMGQGTGAATGDGGFEPVPPGSETFGDEHEGSYHLGPVDFAETQWTNSCGPYPGGIQSLTGPYLAGVDLSLNGDGSLCDACALVTTNMGAQVLVHIVTTGVSNAPGDMDLSPEAYDLIHQEDPEGTPDDPRPMTWQLARCPDAGSIQLQFQTEASIWWTSFWVRNARYPLGKIEVKSGNHADFVELRRGPDGTINDDGGFGQGDYEIRLTSVDGQVLVVSRSTVDAGMVVDTGMQFE